MNKKILKIINSNTLSAIEKADEIEKINEKEKDKAVSISLKEDRLISVSELVNEMINKRPSYYLKVTQKTFLDGRELDEEPLSVNHSIVHIANKVNLLAHRQLPKSHYENSSGPSSPARYPYKWLKQILKEILGIS